jgi:outer membrane protein assembly factor BamB
MNPQPTAGKLRAWQMTAWVAAVFSLLVGSTMILGYIASKSEDPLKSSALKQSKEKLRQNPTDETVRRSIRELDLQLRQRYFRHLAQTNAGSWLLLIGTGVYVLARVQSGCWQRKLPLPKLNPGAAAQAVRSVALARRSVAISGTALGAFLFLLSVGSRTLLPSGKVEVEKLLGAGGDAPPSDAASVEELRRNWPRFRGADGGGVYAVAGLPTGEGAKALPAVQWQSAVPARGFNSPIIWGDRIFFSGGDAATREVFCLDLKTGQMLWRQAVANVPGSPAKVPEVPDSCGYAAPTMATDGRRVYAFFANGDLAAFTLAGQLVWSKGFGVLQNAYGHATSLATWRDRVLLQVDQGESQEGKSKLYAVDGRTGQLVWQRPRPVGSSWATPIVVDAAGKAQVITLAVPWVIAYAAADGTELWRANCLNGEIAPSPIYAAGLVIVVSPSEKLVAIRPDGQGDVTKTHVVWTAEESVPDVTSPTSNGEWVFTVTTGGLLTCLSAKDGKKQWDHDLDMAFHASPSLVGKSLYLFSQTGVAFAIEAAPQFKEISRSTLNDEFHASPAFVEGRVVVRGVTNIWCLGEKAEVRVAKDASAVK